VLPTLLVTALLFLPGGEMLAPWVVVCLLVLTAVMGAALVFRRHRPVAVLVIVTASTVGAVIVGGTLDGVPIALAVYAVAVFVSTRVAWIAFAGAVAACVASAFLTALISRAPADYSTVQGTPIGGSLFFAVFVLVAMLIGASIGDRRRYVAALVDRAEDLARERDQQAQLATAAERARITRELHDIVAHSLSVMVTLADGADALARKDPERSEGAIREIGDVGRRSLVEMRRVLGVLAAPDSEVPLSPQPSLHDLDDLAATFRSAGLPVTIAVEGPRPESPGLQATIYRIVQESLTNALRYAVDPNTVTARISFDAGDGASVTVTDDGRVAPTSVSSVGSGRGLIGMRERASLYGGTVEAGPGITASWRVHVTLPEMEDR
jgi:signal transduction histidine kinase